MFKPLQSRDPLPGHYYSRALSQDSAPLKLAYLLAHTSKRVPKVPVLGAP
jgi:hypothetical protein